MINYRTVFISSLLLLMPVIVSAARIKEVVIRSRDGKPVDPAVVQSFISVRAGHELTRDDLDLDVRNMQKSGRFSYVAADYEPDGADLRLIYIVQLKPQIRRLIVDGGDYISNEKIKDLLEIGVGDPVDDALLASRAQIVREHYRKKLYPFCRVSSLIQLDPDGRYAEVTIKVDEGTRARIKRVTFEGNNSIERSELVSVMKQRRRHLFSWITGSGIYSPEELSEDLVSLRKRYGSEGYLDVSFGEPEIKDLGEGNLEIIIKVDEGEQYRFGDISISGVSVFDPAEVRASVTNQPGGVASTDAINKVVQHVRDYYGSRGYIETIVNYQLDPDLEKNGAPVVSMKMSVREGHLAYVRHVVFRGNAKTKDKVMRREVSVYPGEVMNEVKLRSSENRLRNLGYFSSVSTAQEETADPAKYDAVFDVEEQNTGQFMVGAGFSSIDNLIGFVELQQGNFDVGSWPPVGGGQKLRFNGTVGTKRTDVELSLTEPWFLDRKLSLGGTLFRRDSRFLSDEYKQLNTGGNLTLGVPVAPFTRLNLIYGLEEIRVYDVADDASDLIKAEEGDRLKSSLTSELIFDTRDNVFIPTRGTRAMLSAMGAGGPLGGDTDIYRVDAMASHFTPLWFDHVFNLRMWISGVDFYGDSEFVPIFDRLFLGGARTLRGFKYRDVGPKDETGEPIGGSSMWYATAEYTIPVYKKVRFAGFYDIGMVYEEAFDYEWSEFNSDAGIGVRFDIPGFPLRFDYAWPLETDVFNDRSSGRFQFSIGYSY